MLKVLIRNIPSVVLTIMIATCMAVDSAVSNSPEIILSKIPVIAVTLIYTVLNNAGTGRGKGAEK